MNDVPERKCIYFNSGYCKFSKRETGCKKYHPDNNCLIAGCKDKESPNRHQKKCRYSETYRFQSRCSYAHDNKKKENILKN